MIKYWMTVTGKIANYSGMEDATIRRSNPDREVQMKTEKRKA